MNETTKVIKNRRSIRKYKSKPVNDAEIEAIMEAAIYAPNAQNEQKWHFAVVQNQQMIDKMVDIIKENIGKSGPPFLKDRVKSPDYHTFHHAPAVVFITGDPSSRFIQIDCGAALQTMALAAESLNIGTCPVASSVFLFESESGKAISKQLGIPDNYNFMCSLAMGYPEGEKPAAPPRKKEVIKYTR
jgi:nitroreductase